MKALKKDLQSVVKSLKELTQKTENIAKKLNKLEKAMAVKKPGAKARVKARVPKKGVSKRVVAKKRTRVTAIDAVLKIIQKRKRGVGTAALKKNTGFDEKKIWGIINNLKKQGKIKSGGRGIYLKA